MRSTFSVGQHIGAAALLDLGEALVVGLLERLEGRMKSSKASATSDDRPPPWSRARGMFMRHFGRSFGLIMRVAARMRSASGWPARHPARAQAGEAVGDHRPGVAARQPRIPREPAFEFADGRQLAPPLHRLDARAGQHRKGHHRDLPEVGLEDAAHAARRIASRACTVRKPIDSPSSAPPRISAQHLARRAPRPATAGRARTGRARPRGSRSRRRSARPGRAGTACGCRPAPRAFSDAREGARAPPRPCRDRPRRTGWHSRRTCRPPRPRRAPGRANLRSSSRASRVSCSSRRSRSARVPECRPRRAPLDRRACTKPSAHQAQRLAAAEPISISLGRPDQLRRCRVRRRSSARPRRRRPGRRPRRRRSAPPPRAVRAAACRPARSPTPPPRPAPFAAHSQAVSHHGHGILAVRWRCGSRHALGVGECRAQRCGAMPCPTAC